MSNYDQNLAASGGSALAIDAGLRAYMLRIYNYMAGGRRSDGRRGGAHLSVYG